MKRIYVITGLLIYGLSISNAIGSVINTSATENEKSSSSKYDSCRNIDEDSKQFECYCRERSDLCDEKKSRLSAYQPNYAIFQSTDNDEGSIEAHYSFKYKITKPHCMPLKFFGESSDDSKTIGCLENYKNRWEVFLSFTGEFDFYMGSRHSGPVINRISNPALHYRKHFKDLSWNNLSIEWLNIGLEHKSNGQVVESNELVTDRTSSDFGKYKTQVEFEAGNHEYFDSISRSTNYFSLEAKGKLPYDIRGYAIAKLYINDESDVSWGEFANKDVKISDYDRVNIIVSHTFRPKMESIPEIEVGFEWMVGDDLLETDSYNINLFFPWIPKNNIKIPFYIRAHVGPMNTLSNYTEEQNAIGFGIRLR